MLSLSCDPTSISNVNLLAFTKPLQMPHGIVKCPSNAHFRISPEVVGHSGNFPYSIFPICIWTYYSFGVLNSQHIHASWADSTHVYYEKIKVFLDARRTKLEIFKTAKIVFMGNFWTK